MSKYSFVVSANTRYLGELNVLLNSLVHVKNTQDVHIVSWNLPIDYLQKLNDVNNSLGFNVIVHEISQIPEMIEIGEGECLMRYRYELASSLVEYESVCVLDADSMIIRKLDIWFEIAAKSDVIIGCALEQKRWYGEGFEEHHRVNGEHVISPKEWNDKDIACSPLFFNPNTFGKVFSYSWHIVADYDYEHRFKAPDMDGLAVSILKFGVKDRVIALAEATWSGLHETLLKPFSHICEMHDQLWTINGEEIWLIHGQYGNDIWKGWQIDGQMGCIDRELDGSPRCKQIANQCLEQLVSYYTKMKDYKLKI